STLKSPSYTKSVSWQHYPLNLWYSRATVLLTCKR
ncbi:transposase, partial [Shigella dysenteriae]